MTIPDPFVYASIVPLAATAAKVGQWFVQDVVRQKKSNDQSNAALDQRPTHQEMTMADFDQIAERLKRELNGRYMFAKECREKFAAIETKIDEQSHDLKEFIRAEIAGAAG
jgi:hypothetical protein